jgi:divalent metal cation (Fe/Co/Zn/Cd) transporter
MVLFCLIMGLLFGHMALWDVLGVAMVSVMILRAMVEIVRGSVKELLDYAPSEEVVNQIESLTDEHPEVSLVRDVRVRSVGGEYHVSLAIDIDGRATVRKADDIMQKVKTIIKKDIEDASYIIIQVAPAAEVVSEQG